nr:unnamed protein product [Callosobruchus analis]
MTLVAENLKKCVKKHRYVPHKRRSHPFYCISLPFLATLVSIFYWIVLVPVIFSVLFTRLTYNSSWVVFFFVVALSLFILVLMIFVCVWRCSCRTKTKQTEQSEDMVNMNVMMQHCDTSVEKQASMLGRKNRPAMIQINPSEVPIFDQPASPLSPRELFFIDLIEAAKLPSVKATLRFIEKEREHCVFDSPTRKEEISTISCVEPKESYRSEAYIFVKNTAV